MFIAPATDPLQLLRDVGLARSAEGAHDVRARGCINFPSRLI
jgi:hypothetical protein